MTPISKMTLALALSCVLPLTACSHDEIAAACSSQTDCDDGFNVAGCASEREGALAEMSARCGADAEAAALAVYACFADAGCDADREAVCADELAAFETAADAAGDGCVDAPRPTVP